MRTIETIMAECGGNGAILKAARAANKPLHDSTVRKWRENGIPEKHWSIIMGLASVTPSDLFAANADLRSATPSRSEEAA